MSTTAEQIDALLLVRSEDEQLEFKAAENRYDFEELVGYCVALANEGGGRMILGMTDKAPRRVVGTKAFDTPERTVAGIHDRLHLKVTFDEVAHPSGRVLVFHVHPRPIGQPVHYKGRYFMRAGEELVPMSPDQLKRIFDEGQPDWFDQAAMVNAGADEVIALLDTQMYFDLLKLPYPTSRDGVLAKLSGENLITQSGDGWTISNLAAILLAKRLDAFSPALARKAPRVVIYEGPNKLNTRDDKPGKSWLRGWVWKLGGFCAFLGAAESFRRAGGSRGSEDVSKTSASRVDRECLGASGFCSLGSLRDDRNV